MQTFFKTIAGIGLLVGTIIGAGMFALPYMVVRAGVLWGSIHLIVAFSLLLYLHLLYGEVVFGTPGKHRLPGYAGIYVGGGLRKISFASALLGLYGALLAYGILGGVFLEQLLDDVLPLVAFTILFFILGGFLLAMDLQNVGMINFLLITFLILFVCILVFLAFPYAKISNIGWGVSSLPWFLPYGVFLFAFAGASVIPDVVNVLGNKRKNMFRWIVVVGMLIPLIVYILFIYATAGVSGAATAKDAISGLRWFLGEKAVLLGSLIGLLAVLTSYVSLGTDLKNIFVYDYRWHRAAAWGAVVVVPVVLYLFGVNDFLRTMGLVGAVAIGTDGITILLIAFAEKEKNGHIKKGQRVFLWLLTAGLLLGIGYEIVMFLR